MNPMTPYEQQQAAEIQLWKNAEPGIAGRAAGWLASPLVNLVQAVVPEAAIKGVLDGASWMGEALADSADLLADKRVPNIQALQSQDLALSDELANSVHNWAVGLAAAEGGITGALGLPGLIADIPAVITFALRTIHKIGLCYGFRCETQEDKDFVLMVLSASGANTMPEKLAALATLRSIQVMLARQTWKMMTQKALINNLSREGVIIGMRQLVKQIGINLTKRKVLQAIPVIGAGIGASANAWYIKETGWAARRAFQERWLVLNEKAPAE